VIVAILFAMNYGAGKQPTVPPIDDETRIFYNIRDQYSEDDARAQYQRSKEIYEKWKNDENPELNRRADYLMRVAEELLKAYPAIGEG
jgi:hypothetical protein